ncbi:MAG: PIN domain-containing protein [Deltaproteobacteria bacterium]|nr:PIN domain-containing protein [Deltaproteobacteria bacterium]
MAGRRAARSPPPGGMIGLTFDTGALIGLERRRQRIARVYRTAVEDGLPVTVPAVVISEWWRGRTDVRETILRGVRVEPLDDRIAKLAGEALVTCSGCGAVDSIVMASAARRGDIVYTADVADLLLLQAFFPTVRVLSV